MMPCGGDGQCGGKVCGHDGDHAMALKHISAAATKRLGDKLGVDWTAISPVQFRMGLMVELEHGARDPETDVTHDDALLTGKIAWAHLKEFPDYYTRLACLENEAKAYWASGPKVGKPATRKPSRGKKRSKR